MESLQAEAREDELLRGKHGTQRWTRVSSPEASKPLQEQGDRLGGFLKMAEDSDSMVRSKLLEWEDVITLLSRDKVQSVTMLLIIRIKLRRLCQAPSELNCLLRVLQQANECGKH